MLKKPHTRLKTSGLNIQNYDLHHATAQKKKVSDAKTHQTGLEALHTDSKNTFTSSLNLVIDCGETHHMFNTRSLFTNFTNSSNEKITTSDPSSSLICKGRGTVKILINDNLFTLKNCLYVPKLTKNLLSLLDLCEAPITITKNNSNFHLSKNNRVFLSGCLINKLMVVTFNQTREYMTEKFLNPLWHSRLGHPSKQVLKSLGLKPINYNSCDICPLDCIHTDIVGPISPPSKSGYCYFLTIIDQYTSYKIDRFSKTKSEAYEEFLNQKNLMENAQDKKIKKIPTDGGGEFVNHRFKTLSNQNGFTHFIAPAYTPDHNGFAERANCTILDKARCLLLTSKLLSCYWAKAINTATHLSNLIPKASRNNM
ncbi:hypothetical protein O181_002904 [Austropuccinia psidii MF-1]|uniref:Integrase catalytic domain-containing protein n=1 Tax=Austropuccinia psidii MF-1 TaxID=1389203 RepID=A0A9Q3BDB8_9BASI|nr:hypothetical protein [Austropuccinia psidii MF-1]